MSFKLLPTSSHSAPRILSQLCALAQKSRENVDRSMFSCDQKSLAQNNTCKHQQLWVVTTNNGLKRHHLMSVEPKVCLLFFSIQSLIFYLAFVRCEEVPGGRGKGQWWLGPNDASGVIWALGVCFFKLFHTFQLTWATRTLFWTPRASLWTWDPISNPRHVFERRDIFSNPPDPPFEPQTPFRTPDVFLNPRTCFQTPWRVLEPHCFQMPGTCQTLLSNPRPVFKCWDPFLNPPDPPFEPRHNFKGQTRFWTAGPRVSKSSSRNRKKPEPDRDRNRFLRTVLVRFCLMAAVSGSSLWFF